MSELPPQKIQTEAVTPAPEKSKRLVNQISLSTELDENAKTICQELLRDEYMRVGYEPVVIAAYDTRGERLAIYDETGEIIGTIGLLLDEAGNPESLPAGTLFKEEVAKLQEGGTRLIEIGQFATLDTVGLARSALKNLVDQLVVRAKSLGAQVAVITVNPRHAPLYERLGFSRVEAGTRHYEEVGAPAVLLSRPVTLQ
ncbi:MAG: hypothetical protein AAB442_01850 [Patescibacteria group bacterium]